MKSYKPSTIQNISSNADLINQFKAYLGNANVNSISSFEYIFDKRKLLKEFYQGIDGADLSKLFDNEAAAEKFIKEEFQKLYKGQKGTEIFQSIIDNQALRDSLFDINSPVPLVDQFNALVDNLDSALYQFIKVQ